MITNAALLKIIEQVLAREAIVRTFEFGKSILTKSNKAIKHDIDHYRASIGAYLRKTVIWSEESSFQGMFKDKFTDEIFVETDYYLAPIREMGDHVQDEINLIENIFNETNKHIIILGEPGSGKTTCSKIITRRLLFDNEYLPHYTFPLVIRFREINYELNSISSKAIKIDNTQHYLYENNLLFWLLYEKIGIQFKTDNKEDLYKELKGGYVKQYVKDVIEEIKPLIILEGFDELDKTFRKTILNEIEELCLSISSGRIFITSRTGEFDFKIGNTRKFQLKPFNEEQIKKFCLLWMEDEEKGNLLFNIIKESPFFDTSIRPLNLSFLAMLFEANGTLPSKPKYIYKKLVELQLFKWDKDRKIERESQLSNFDSTSKFDFLYHLAYELSKDERTVFNGYLFEAIYNKLSNTFELLEKDREIVVNELENHSGLFIQSGNNSFSFPHKSIQEYLAAEYLVRYRPLLDLKSELKKMPHELAVGTSLSTNPNHMFFQAIQIYLGTNSNVTKEFKIYLERLIIEKVSFNDDYKTAILIISLWNKYYSNLPIEKTLLMQLYKLNGISTCFKSLEKHYKLSGIDYLKLKTINTKKRFYEYICLLNKRNKKNSVLTPILDTPLFFLQDWKFINIKFV